MNPSRISLVSLLCTIAVFDISRYSSLLKCFYKAFRFEVLCYFLVLLHSIQMRLAYLLWLDQLHETFLQVSYRFLKTLTFNLYLLLSHNLICQCGPNFHLNVDDKQIDIIKLSLNIPSATSMLPSCKADDRVWMFRHFVQFNASKTCIASEWVDTI